MNHFEELAEADASGEIAQIYHEIRQTYGAPYVSSLQRHLATKPGVLEWAWNIVAPGFRSGLIPETAWQIARETADEIPHETLDTSALAAMRIDNTALHAIRNVCKNFVRVAPLNLLFAGCIRAILEGAPMPSRHNAATHPWTPPAPLGPMPAMMNPEHLPRAQRLDLLALSSQMGSQQFIPGLYRVLAHWPAYLHEVATQMGPKLSDPTFRARGEQLADKVVSAVPMILQRLPKPDPRPAPDPGLHAGLLQATATYRRTSPEMVLVGSMLLAQLPDATP